MGWVEVKVLIPKDLYEKMINNSKYIIFTDNIGNAVFSEKDYESKEIRVYAEINMSFDILFKIPLKNMR